MSGAAAGVVLAFLLATAYGSAFHFLMGGPARHIVLYLIVAWIGFGVGHLFGNWLQFNLLQLGALNLFSASLGAWISLIASWWLVKQEL